MSNSHCYHCSLPIPQGVELETVILGETRAMCCVGCQAVSQAIVDNQLDDYYRFRTEPAQQAEIQGQDILQQLSLYDDPSIQEEFVALSGDEHIIQLSVDGISCSACGWLIEKKLAQLNGVKRIAVNVSAQRATVTWDNDNIALSDILLTLERVGYHALPFQPDQHEAGFKAKNKQYLKQLGLAGLMTMQVMMLAIGLYFSLFGFIEAQTRDYFHYISLLLTIPVVSYSATPFYQGALRAIRNTTVNMDVPISIAIIAGFVASCYSTFTSHGAVYFESMSMFVFLLLVSRFLEHKSRARATEMSSNSIKHIPVTANTLTEHGDISVCAAKLLQPNDMILVRAGETIPADATVITGQSEVDESMLTGEFELVEKSQGQKVYGGTINHNGIIECRVDSQLKDALVNQIMRLQELAMASKPKISQFADRFSRYFITSVLLIAAISALIWLSIDQTMAFPVAIAVLVATCPCALGLATPVALTCAMAKLSRRGILIKQVDTLEKLVSIDHVAFDKTGTLTEGKFSVREFNNYSDLPEQKIHQLVASLEQRSEHPIAKPLKLLSSNIQHVRQAKVSVGEGIKGEIDDVHYYIGSRRFAEQTGLSLCDIPKHHNALLFNERATLASFYLSDNLKPDSLAAIEQLKPLETSIISGDSQLSVAEIATAIGITNSVSEASPQDKLDTIKQLQQDGQQVLMVGDGINDAPTLAAADVSIAIGGATDLAQSAADVIMMDDKMLLLAELLSAAKRVNLIIKQNIGWAIGYNLSVLPLAVCGILSPWVAVIGMSLSSIIVVSNSVRLLR